jgi:hypothetical protein
MDLGAERPDPDEAMARLYLYYLMPLWTLAGVVLGLLCEMDAGLFAAMATLLMAHQGTAYYDSYYAAQRRKGALAVAGGLHWDTLRRGMMLLGFLPYANEFCRCVGARRG